jgi:hypothetical protein
VSTIFFQPAALVGLLLAIPVVILYRRRARMPRRQVAAAPLWARVLAAHPTRARWLPWRRAASLAVQLCLLTALVAAVAEPYWRAPQSVVLILDNAGGESSEVGSPALERVKRLAAARVDALDYRDRAAIVVTSGDLRVRCALTGSHELLLRAIESLEVAERPGTVADAEQLAQRILPPDAAGRTVVVAGDGADAASTAALPPWSILALVALGLAVADWGLYQRRWLE